MATNKEMRMSEQQIKVRDVIRWLIADSGNHIRRLKDEAAEVEARTVYTHVSSGERISEAQYVKSKRNLYADNASGCKLEDWKEEEVPGYISPNFEYWHVYVGVKREVTFWLAALQVEKAGKGSTALYEIKERLEKSFPNVRIGIKRLQREALRRHAKIGESLIDGKEYPRVRKFLTAQAARVEQASREEAAHA